LGAGFSLKFIDLYLKTDYGVSPAGVFAVAFFQNIVGALLTPCASSLFVAVKGRGCKSKAGVLIFWSSSLVFLGLLIIPGMPLWVVLLSIVMKQSLSSCTKCFMRAKLHNYLPPDKIARYTSWDALNKANQGGIAIFGAQVVEAAKGTRLGGYRACFLGTFIILSIRWLIYFLYIIRTGASRRAKRDQAESSSSSNSKQRPAAPAPRLEEASLLQLQATEAGKGAVREEEEEEEDDDDSASSTSSKSFTAYTEASEEITAEAMQEAEDFCADSEAGTHMFGRSQLATESFDQQTVQVLALDKDDLNRNAPYPTEAPSPSMLRQRR